MREVASNKAKDEDVVRPPPRKRRMVNTPGPFDQQNSA